MKNTCQLNEHEVAQAIRDYARKQGFEVKSSINFNVNPVSATFEAEQIPHVEEDDYEWAWSQGR